MSARVFLSAFYVAAGIMLAGPSAAQQIESSYTDVDLDQCTVIQSDDFGSRWACSGLKGMPVMIAEGDLRMFVSYGLTSTTEKAAEQTLGPFNRLGDKIEWRVSNAEGSWKPFATILRFFTKREEGEPEGQVLVVTKIAPGATCHIAYVDALANPDPNGLARKAADTRAKDFDCAKDEPEYIGKFEAWER
ncbi:MAG: hypothetical protein JWQ89_3760 [Devosia sp.]|uniref:hypothetical protein n=1 Tax=Devosia sp. TaxID=1871048 RepID=UPI002604EF06|nr:hypothetical protein [Devosia sp.]MDB5542033.1 hypothetical protein [Devosia sp.]